jgi:hypothetical protein
VSGGWNGVASSSGASVSGGYANRVVAQLGSVSGGCGNLAGSDLANTDTFCSDNPTYFPSVSGGEGNTASANRSAIFGGLNITLNTTFGTYPAGP